MKNSSQWKLHFLVLLENVDKGLNECWWTNWGFFLSHLRFYCMYPFICNENESRHSFFVVCPGNAPEVHLLHLHVAVYMFFHRLYAMYPNNFLAYLRVTYSKPSKQKLFQKAIKVRILIWVWVFSSKFKFHLATEFWKTVCSQPTFPLLYNFFQQL